LFDLDYSRLLTREFNLVTPENAMKWEIIHPEQERYDFEQADFIVDFARRNGLKVRGHTLVWTLQLPDWVEQGSFTRQEWIDLLRDHIHTVVGRYRGNPGDRTVIAWDVVNEAIQPDGSYLENLWYSTIGPEYIPLAFQFAHEADPQALLFYNDFDAEGMNRKSQAVYDLVKGLKEAGVPIHGVGMEMHITLDGQPTADDLAANLRRLGDLGLIVHITEMDVRTQEATDVLNRSEQSLPDKREYSSALLAQAEVYRRVFTACLQAPNCQAFVTWGLTDRQSWIPGWTGRPDAPLLFDEAGRPKPAYDALIEALKGLR
jgi:endo-1,4-beta-xylanase